MCAPHYDTHSRGQRPLSSSLASYGRCIVLYGNPSSPFTLPSHDLRTRTGATSFLPFTAPRTRATRINHDPPPPSPPRWFVADRSDTLSGRSSRRRALLAEGD